MTAKFKGKVWKFGDNVNGDDGILDFSAVRDHSKPFDEKTLAKLCFAGLNPDFQTLVRPGDIVVGGINFAKPGHDQVVVAIKGSGIQAIVCESCEARFIRKGFNIGLPIVVCPGITDIVEQDDMLQVDLALGIMRNTDTGACKMVPPCPERMLELLDHGGVIPFLTEHIRQRRTEAEAGTASAEG